MNIVVIYDLTLTIEAEEQDKLDFYNELQDLLEKLPGRDVNIVMGDANVKLGGCNVGYEDVMDRFADGTKTENDKDIREYTK